MAKTRSKPRIGISGWTYGPWRGTFYPKKLKHREELSYASRKLSSIEINGTFYSLQQPKSFAGWYEQTPDDFIFSVKGGQYITHMKRLKNVESALANFFASGILRLKEKLGPILWQMPPNFKFDADVLAAFFELLPRDTLAAAKMAEKHEAFLKGRSWIDVKTKRPLRYAMEVRHESFRTPQFIDILRKHRIALCIAETAGKWPFMEDVTADFLYVRLHGDEQIYVSGYTDKALDQWADKLDAWRHGGQPKKAARVSDRPPPKRKSRDVFVYFDNDVKVRSPVDAMGLAQRLSGGVA
jgi:uncharacterized protein YecE (DUF72 family)